MKQQLFKIKLYEANSNKLKKESYVYEFDDDCLNANLFYDAVEEFKDIIEPGDIIKYLNEEIRYNNDGTGTIIILGQ